MDVKQVTPFLSVSPQISEADLSVLKSLGFRTIINNRPDGEEDRQPSAQSLEQAARAQGLDYIHQPIVPGQISEDDISAFAKALGSVQGPVLAFCRTGTRAISLWALSEAWHLDPQSLLHTAKGAGYDLSGLADRLSGRAASSSSHAPRPVTAVRARYDVVIVGGGAGGISAAASLLKRRPELDIALIEPRNSHYYQPGWTLVGGGVFDRRMTEKPMADVMVKGVHWVRTAAAGFEPEDSAVVLEDGERLFYQILIVAPGLKLDWGRIEGLGETLGKNGVTSNYLYGMAPYTWELVQNMKEGRALFCQPPMPIKCAGAPQKAMYLACDHWTRSGAIKAIDVSFHNAGGVLFGVKDYVPALEHYVERYGIGLNFNRNLIAVDGPGRMATFKQTDAEGREETVTEGFDMIHVVPSQCAPDFVRQSPLAGEAGWVDVNAESLRHTRFGNVFALGDVCSAPNAKTAAAVRKQAPVVAENALAVLDGKPPRAIYDGYGSCPLTVERGKIVLAEFGYGGKLLPTFPTWVVDGTRPSNLSWFLKEKMLPAIYWRLMLKGHEWLAKPDHLAQEAPGFEALDAHKG